MSGKEMIVINDAQVLNELLCNVAQLLIWRSQFKITPHLDLANKRLYGSVCFPDPGAATE
jgi:hypothetical protein